MQAQEQRQPTQLLMERTPYRTPKLTQYGKLASLVEGGTAQSGTESGTVAISITL